MAWRWIWVSLSTLAVVAIVGLVVSTWNDGNGSPAAADADGAPDIPPDVLAPDAHYYLLLSAIEVTSKRGGDGKWDANGSAPDLYYEIRWQDHVIFRSATKKNTLLAKWSNVEFGIGPLVGGKVSLDDSIKAARITARPGDKVEFAVWDEDALKDDLVARWSVDVASLRQGDRRWEKPAGDLVGVTCRVLPMDDVAFEALTK